MADLIQNNKYQNKQKKTITCFLWSPWHRLFERGLRPPRCPAEVWVALHLFRRGSRVCSLCRPRRSARCSCCPCWSLFTCIHKTLFLTLPPVWHFVHIQLPLLTQVPQTHFPNTATHCTPSNLWPLFTTVVCCFGTRSPNVNINLNQNFCFINFTLYITLCHCIQPH